MIGNVKILSKEQILKAVQLSHTINAVNIFFYKW
jgi:hypothetical protein